MSIHFSIKSSFENLEFHKLLAHVSLKCFGEAGRNQITSPRFSTNKTHIAHVLQEIHQLVRLRETGYQLPISAYEPVEDLLKGLAIEDYVADLEALSNVHKLTSLVDEFKTSFTPKYVEQGPLIYSYVENLGVYKPMLKILSDHLTEQGEIRNDASQALQKIRSSVIRTKRELDVEFGRLVQLYKKQGYLADISESLRNGRRVVCVRAESKRKIRGIIHDESSTGKSVFIEPEPIILINNKLYDFYTEEKKEIYRILKMLSDHLRPFGEQINQMFSTVVAMDVLQAKAKLAAELNAALPEIVDGPKLYLKQSRHPLLLLTHSKLNKETMPFDLVLLKGNRILVLSGPNAGGKTIVMKAVGLIQLMAQCGFLPPVSADSEIGIFDKIFIDIGDQQSLEDALSTYSSRLNNMKHFLDHSDENSLILIDEFGSGTDPTLGGAIAESVLKSFHKKRVFGVITTHYPNIKVYAFRNRGLVNGSMEFDKIQLKPTFRLQVGKPGSSYAFEIAKNTGFDDEILKYAKRRAGKDERAVDELLVNLQEQKKQSEEKLEQVNKEKSVLDRLIKNYQSMFKTFEAKRKRLKLEEKELSQGNLVEIGSEMKKVLKEIRDEKSLEKAEQLAMEIQQETEKLSKEIVELEDQVYFKDDKIHEKVKEGSFVKLRKSDSMGRVLRIEKKKATVVIGELQVEIPLKDLLVANEPLPLNPTKGVKADLMEKGSAKQRIDIRGIRRTEALDLIEQFVDGALMNNLSFLEIIHGKGNGVLKKAVLQKLKEFKQIKEISHPQDD